VPLLWHLTTVAVVFGVLGGAVARFLLPDRDDQDAPSRPGGERGPLPWRSIGPAMLAVGLIAAMAQSMEDVGATWSSVYLREDLGAAAAVSGLGFIALQGMQTVGRLLGDRFVTRFGDRAVALGGATLAGGAMALALALPTTVGTVLAFGAVGLGIGTLIPAAMRAADSVPGLPRGLGLALVGTVNRVALAGPPLIGLVADAAGLRVALLATPVAALVVLGLSPALAGRSDRATAR
jgi:fucose permease